MLPVWFEDYHVGAIAPSEDGPAFTYEGSWQRLRGAFPLSLTMPLGETKVPSSLFAPWAANLLPEAAQLAAVGRQLGVSPGDLIGLLEQIGRDTAGALSFGASGATSTYGWHRVDGEAALERIIDQLPSKPFLVGEEGVSMSLAGVQTKLAVAVDRSGAIFVPLDGSPSTHVLKPDADKLRGSVENEAYCLALARRCGIAVPDFTTGRAGSRTYLLIERYDRRGVESGWRRIHQEDFCQALGRWPSAKYERNQTGVRGPSLVDMVRLARDRLGTRDVLALLDVAIFNILACNTDAHAKNYSILIGARGAGLAPAYDIMCAEPYENITRNLAQTIAGKNRGEHLKRRHWERFFREARLGVRPSLERVSRLANAVLAEARNALEEVEALPAGAGGMARECVEAVRARAEAVLAGLADDRGSQETAEAEA
jgi:serine/threonine-protein kinase HipA